MPESNLEGMFEADVPTQESVDTVHIDKISIIANAQVAKKEELMRFSLTIRGSGTSIP